MSCQHGSKDDEPCWSCLELLDDKKSKKKKKEKAPTFEDCMSDNEWFHD